LLTTLHRTIWSHLTTQQTLVLDVTAHYHSQTTQLHNITVLTVDSDPHWGPITFPKPSSHWQSSDNSQLTFPSSRWVILSNSVQPKFQHSIRFLYSGIRVIQGCVLSYRLFVIIVEVINQELQEAHLGIITPKCSCAKSNGPVCFVP